MTKPKPLPVCYFDNRDSNYWLQLDSCRYQHLGVSDLKLRMKHAGLDTQFVPAGSDLTLFESVQCKAQLERWVDYAGPLAGCKVGPVDIGGGKRILVTSECNMIEAKKGRFPGIEKFLTELFGNDQLMTVLYWLKLSHESLCTGKFKPGQLFVMAGPPGCGKSFMHSFITYMLGGRAGKPYRYMTGQTHFNSDLAGSEHLVIEDENARSNTTSRREFGTAIKDWTVNEMISVHAKGREALSLSFFRRLSLSVNWETEYLLILPPMDQSIQDKVMLFKCGHASLSPDREENKAMLIREMPGFIAYLRSLRIPAGLRCDRFGVKAFHHPEILEILSDASDENKLLELIDNGIFGGADAPDMWRGSAMQLQQELSSGLFGVQAAGLFRYPSACGTFLDRLATHHSERFEKRKNAGKTVWQISAKQKGKD